MCAAPLNAYDFVVVGGGTAGLVAAGLAAKLGANVAMISKDPLGGECLFTGCVPSKALLSAAKTRWASYKAAQTYEQDWQAPDSASVWKTAKQQVQSAILQLAHHSDEATMMKEYGVKAIYRGSAKFIAPHELEVTQLDSETPLRVRGKKILIATGAKAFISPIKGLNSDWVDTHESIFDLEHLPEHLVILGGGPIGCELAQAFNRLGSKVSLIQRGGKLAPKEDETASELLKEQLESEGVGVVLWHQASECKKLENGQLELTLTSASDESLTLQCDRLLVATGKRPNLESLDLDQIGLTPQKNYLETNNYGQTKLPWLYAAGDCATPFQFTHYAEHMAKVATMRALFGPLLAPILSPPLNTKSVPKVTFTEPEIASIGISYKEAKALEPDCLRFELPLSEVDRFVCEDESTGYGAIWTRKNGTILGATIVGSNSGELLQGLGLLMMKKQPLSAYSDLITAYPTRGDSLKSLAYEFSTKQFLSGLPLKVIQSLVGILKQLPAI